MIGLRRDTIQVVQHDQRWAALFEHERQILHEHLGILVLDIQHIGSTAASTVDAKPIIDGRCSPSLATLIAEILEARGATSS
jgi:GrpB-like predicted nucleotidyltransferase (UPF0157 family)